jgi:hypothetical protein
MTLALSTTTWAALALMLPADLRARIVTALRAYDRNDRSPVAIWLSLAEAHRVDLALRRITG